MALYDDVRDLNQAIEAGDPERAQKVLDRTTNVGLSANKTLRAWVNDPTSRGWTAAALELVRGEMRTLLKEADKRETIRKARAR